MASFGEYLTETLDGLRAIFESDKGSDEDASRLARMRIGFLAMFAVDVIAVAAFVLMSGGRPLDLEVWFQPGFPSNMIVFRNEGSEPLRNVRLRLDNQYSLQVDALPPGLRGFELNRDFRDGANQPPPDAYRPLMVHVATDGDQADIPVESRTGL